jgi:CHAD domain-containing protein
VPDAGIGTRDELHSSGTSDVIPDDLRDLVTPWVRTAVLGPVATLVTQRTVHVLRDASGDPLVELTDDLVSVMSSGHVAGRFREIEVEDRGGGLRAIESVGNALRAGGAVSGEFLPKVVRALGPQATADPDPPLPTRVARDEPARVGVRDILRRNVRTLIANDIAVRRRQPDAVHQIRVASRRLRSMLRAFGSLLDPEWANALRYELKWLADALAGARDSEVLLERLIRDVDELPPDLLVGPVRARIEQVVGGNLESGGDKALETLRSERYVVLLERLVDAAWEPMTAPAADAPVSQILPALVRGPWAQLERDAKRLSESSPSADWHRVRIDAKAVRYICEGLEPMFGKPARELAWQAERLQEVLGEHQDAIIAAEVLHTMATARGGGTVAFTLGVLHSRETAAADAARAEFRQLWAEASRPKLRRWLAD